MYLEIQSLFFFDSCIWQELKKNFYVQDQKQNNTGNANFYSFQNFSTKKGKQLAFIDMKHNLITLDESKVQFLAHKKSLSFQ